MSTHSCTLTINGTEIEFDLEYDYQPGERCTYFHAGCAEELDLHTVVTDEGELDQTQAEFHGMPMQELMIRLECEITGESPSRYLRVMAWAGSDDDDSSFEDGEYWF